MWIAIAFIIGVLVGIGIIKIIISRTYDGDIYLDNHDPYFATAGFNFNKTADEVNKKKYIIIRVNSQK